MRTKQLHYAEVALRSGSMRQAAHELGITQPSLSQQIQRLEEDLGVVLFVRTSSGVSPTSAAELLIPHLRALLRAERAMRQAASAISNIRVGELRIGSVPTACRLLLPAAVQQFRQEHPNIEFQVTERGSDEVYDAVTKGDFDLGLVSRFISEPPSPQVSTIDLCATGLMVCVPLVHPLSTQDVILPDELEGEPLIAFQSGYMLRRILDKLSAGRRLNAVFQTASSDTARALVSAGVGLAILPALAIPTDDVEHREYRAIPLDAPWAWTVISAIRRSDEQPSSSSVAILRMLRTVAAKVTLERNLPRLGGVIPTPSA